MIYSEAAYFDGAHVQHIADWQDEKCRERIWEDHRAIADRMLPRAGRHTFPRIEMPVDITDEDASPEFAAARRYLEGKSNG